MYYNNGDKEMGNYLNDKKIGMHMILYIDGKNEIKNYDKKEDDNENMIKEEYINNKENEDKIIDQNNKSGEDKKKLL